MAHSGQPKGFIPEEELAIAHGVPLGPIGVLGQNVTHAVAAAEPVAARIQYPGFPGQNRNQVQEHCLGELLDTLFDDSDFGNFLQDDTNEDINFLAQMDSKFNTRVLVE